MTRIAFGLLSLLLVAATATPARADVDAPPPVASRPADPPDTFSRWYGWQTLLADAAGIAAVAGCATLVHDQGMVCVAPFALASPAVHVAHGHPLRGALSFAMNLGLPLAGGAIGAAAADCHNDEFLCGLSEIGLGIIVGVVAAATVDAMIAFDDEAPAPAPQRSLPVLPTVSLSSGGAGLGFAGRF
jgi:hypothetical protein